MIAAGVTAPLSEHEVLVFLVQVTLLIGLARVLGGLMKKLNQPAVIGELLAGVLLGPSVLGAALPGVHRWLFVADPVVMSATFGLAWLGVVMLLVVIGFETDLAIINRFRVVALIVAAGSLLAPMLATGLASFFAPESFLGENATRPLFAAFMALALSVSALPVVAKILQDLGLLRRNFGQIILASAMIKDASGWLILALLSGIALEGLAITGLAFDFGGLALFILVMFTVGRKLLDFIYRRVLATGSSVTAALTIALVAALTGGAITQALNVEAILGAYLVGIVLAGLRHQLPQVRERLETITTSFFAPIFFAFSGLRVDLGAISQLDVALWTVGLILLAMAAQFGGSIVSGRAVGLSTRESLTLGSGLSALGVMGVVVAIVGFNVGILSDAGYTVLILAALATSLVAPFLLRLTAVESEMSTEEAERLRKEEIKEGSELLGVRRILLPTRGGTSSRYAARLVRSVFEEAEVTVLSVNVSAKRRILGSSRDQEAKPDDVMVELPESRLVKKRASNAIEAIADEARLGYDLIVLGASEPKGDSERVFSSIIERVLARVDLPTVVVRFPNGTPVPEGLPRRVLVPVTATRSTRAAEELAYSIVKQSGGSATAMHVVTRPDGGGMMLSQPSIDDAVRTGQEMVRTAALFGERLGVDIDTAVDVAVNAEEEVLARANEGGYDLLVLGSANRPLTDRPFYGHRVSYMIEHANLPVVVVSLPSHQAAS